MKSIIKRRRFLGGSEAVSRHVTLLRVICCVAATAFCCLATAAFAQSAIYAYDSLNRLTNVNYGNGAVITYTYDAAGNRLTYSGTVTNDAIYPTIAITSPTSGPTFST